MTRLRKFHFVVHNQGPYSPNIKEDFLQVLKAKYGANLEGHLIAQEMYSHDPTDSHLQGNLFFKNALQFTGLLKVLQKAYPERQTPEGLKGRTDLSEIRSEGRAYSYMMDSQKVGGDPDPLTDHTQLDRRRFDKYLDTEIQRLILAVEHQKRKRLKELIQ